jgi:hypothetical protein
MGTAYPSGALWCVPGVFGVVCVVDIFSFLYCVFCFALFDVLCQMFPMYLDCPFVCVPSVSSKFYLFPIKLILLVSLFVGVDREFSILFYFCVLLASGSCAEHPFTKMNTTLYSLGLMF